MTDLDTEPLQPHVHSDHVSINMDSLQSRTNQLTSSSKAAVTDLVYFISPTTELAIKVDSAGGRLVRRSSGRSLVQHINVPPQHRVGFVRDFFTTVVNSRWYCIILFFSSLYISSWLLFGSIWLALNSAYDSGGDEGNRTCVTHVTDYPSAFLFSLETQMTIGYGFKYITNECQSAIIVIIIQCVLGLLLDSFLLGLIFTKLSRPRNRRRTLLFSNHAVIREKGEGRVLEFRIADVRRTQVVEGHVRLQLYWYREVSDGGYDLQQYDLDVGYDTGRDRLFLLTPVSVYHYITEDSPLHGMTQEILSSSHLELVVILEGIVEVTGLTSQALWSYTNKEILLDCEFVPVMSHRKGRWQVDFSKLSSITPCKADSDDLYLTDNDTEM